MGQSIFFLGQELAHSARASSVSVVIHCRLIFLDICKAFPPAGSSSSGVIKLPGWLAVALPKGSVLSSGTHRLGSSVR